LAADQVQVIGDSGPSCLADEIDALVERLEGTHGKDYLGLPTKTLPTFDKYTLGVRGFNLLAAEPGVGKTSLGVQIGYDIVEKNPHAVFIFFTFEMSRRDIQHRLLAMISALHWRTIVLGSPGTSKTFGGSGLAFNIEDTSAFWKAVTVLKSVGNRVFIYDAESMPETGYEAMLAAVRNAKNKAGVERAFVLVDSLQAMPFTKPQGTPWSSDVERDNFVINRMLALQRATGDALLLISEQNKEGLGKSTFKSTRGTARAVYSPDCVFILQRSEHNQPDAEAAESNVNLKIIKGRDGTLRGTIPLTFQHVTCTFSEFDQVAAIPSGQQGFRVTSV
ncbi:MAG TPA: DnaB-like helicase C-terminal domain-containing protein, partial [Phycisphaerae bacterium]|nr:DnaB-like helicase C-terminal domain-containing protein [Phycisphaerae bacterium]